LLLPATMAPALLNGSKELEDRSFRGYTVAGYLVRDATLPRAQADADVAMRQLAQASPAPHGGVGAAVMPFSRPPRGPQRFLAASLGVLQAIMLLLLLAVCGNTATLIL